MAPNEQAPSNAAPSIKLVPEWVKEKNFENILRENVPEFSKIIEFSVAPAMIPGEIYASEMFRISIEVQLEDGKSKSISYMLKVPPMPQKSKAMISLMNYFPKEILMYQEFLPEFEKMYKDCGKDLKLMPKYYKLNIGSASGEAILMEDLTPQGFKNANRIEGLDMEHTKWVLQKMAEFHAVSACRYATKGRYPDMLMNGVVTEENRSVFEARENARNPMLLNCIQRCKGNESYAEKFEKLQKASVDQYIRVNEIDFSDFNVLNHGDCWSSNCMFQYNDNGEIKDAIFVDFQMCKYGSPAQDLYYLLFTSAALEHKLTQFNFFIKFYHDHLVENLQVLQYPKNLPRLTQIHISMYKHSFWGFLACTGVLASALMDLSDNSSLENFFEDTEAGREFKERLYSNPRYVQHLEELLPWLHNRGLFEVQ